MGGTEAKAGSWPWAVILGKPKDAGSFQVTLYFPSRGGVTDNFDKNDNLMMPQHVIMT